jgi:hypothetical protein
MTSDGFSNEGTKTVLISHSSQGHIFLITGLSEGDVGTETAISLAHGSSSTMLLLGRSLAKVQLQ